MDKKVQNIRLQKNSSPDLKILPKPPRVLRKPKRNFGPYKSRSMFRSKSKLNRTVLKNAIASIKKVSSVFNVYRKTAKSQNKWHSQWGNLHLHYQTILIRNLIQKYYIQHGLYVNKLYIGLSNNNLKVLAHGLGVFKAPKAKKNIAKYKKNIKSTTALSKIGKFLIEINKVAIVRLNFYQLYLPRRYRLESTVKAFKKQKRQIYFWESLQLIYVIFRGYGSADLLGSLIYTYTRKNPRRVAFLAYIKRLLSWHYKTIRHSRIQGVRIEVKGRFNAKSRARKRIISVGCVKIHVKTSNVDYVRLDAITKFGCLGIKVWVCPQKPKKTKLAENLKISKLTIKQIIIK